MIYLRTGIGIELRGEDMLIASLQSNFSGGFFTHFKRIANFRLRNKEELKQEISFFFRSNGLGRDSIVLGISRRDVVMRHLDLPAEVVDNLKQVIQYQVQSFEPTEEDRYYYDYALLGDNGTKKRLTVLLAMVRKAYVDDLLRLLHELGIRPVAVTGSSMALANIFLQNRKDLKDKTFILADLAPASVELMALRHGAMIYSREVSREDGQNWGSLVLREIDEATSKIRLGPEGLVEKIALAGESSESAYGEIRTAIPECELFKGSIPVQAIGETGAHMQEAAAAIGLAYTGIMRRPAIRMNLLPAALRVHQARWTYIPAAILGLAIIALLVALGIHSMIQNRMLIRELDREISRLNGPVAGVQAIRSQTEALEKRISSLEGLLRKKDMNLEILQELTTKLPADTFLSMYTYRDGTIQISGSSGSPSDLIPTLEKSPLLKDVVQKGPIFKNQQTGKAQFSFEMKLER
jgi:Tfp pilus assembly protein PilN